MLRKKANGVAIGSRTSSFIGKAASKIVDRRTFLRGSGLAVGGIAAVTALSGRMVKPALAYLDVIQKIEEKFHVPLAAYNVSGEYSIIKAAAERGFVNGTTRTFAAAPAAKLVSY